MARVRSERADGHARDQPGVLVGDAAHPNAMPLDKFIEETMQALGTDAEEVLVEMARPNRNNVGPGEHQFVNQLNAAVEGVLTPDVAPSRH